MHHDCFRSLGLSDALLRALEEIGYEKPTPIQNQSIPHLLSGKDLLGLAQTGTGKTAAFGLPLLQRLAGVPGRPNPGRPRALVLAPTRELALQIHEEIERFGRHLNLTHGVIFGGVGQRPQIDRLRRGLDLLIATPGRLLDLMGQRHVDLGAVEILVLDEADRLLDMGFIRDVKRIVKTVPSARQSLLFSATMPKEVTALANEMLKQPVQVDVSPKERAVKRIRQRLIRVDNPEKRWVLEHLLREDEVSRAIVFTRTKHGANKVAKHLLEAGIGAEAIHGNKSQNARQRALANFKDGSTWVLVATDIAARGIDVQGISHVINYELPNEPESYVHRIGRTARAGAGGAAWSLVDQAELKLLKGIERLVGRIPDEAEVALDQIQKPARTESDGNADRAGPGRNPQHAARAGSQSGSQSGSRTGAGGERHGGDSRGSDSRSGNGGGGRSRGRRRVRGGGQRGNGGNRGASEQGRQNGSGAGARGRRSGSRSSSRQGA